MNESDLLHQQMEWQEQLKLLQTAIGHTFRQPSFLVEALTHSTYRFEHAQHQLLCNERLEFLGDSVLGLSIANYLFRRFPKQPEGRLTKLKMLLVCEQTLALVAKDISLSAYLLLGRGEDHSGGRFKPSNLSNAVEAVLGAVLLDSDFQTAEEVTLRLLKPYIELAEEGKLIYDYKTVLLEKIQRKYHSSQLEFRVLAEKGPAHAPTFTIGVYLTDIFLAQESGTSKKEAEQAAAKLALKVLEKDKHVFEIH